MKICFVTMLFGLCLLACNKKAETTQPVIEDITESVYASGMVKSKDQYQVFATVSGIIQKIHVREGDTIGLGAPLFSVLNEQSRMVRENAQLAAELADFTANAGRLEELRMQVDLSHHKMTNDSLLWIRQKNLWEQQIGSKVDLERASLAFQNSKTQYESARIRHADEKRRLKLMSQQALKNLQISRQSESDFVVTSKLKGRVFTLYKEEGEIVTPQMPLAVIGAADHYLLELQVDEYDIIRLRPGQTVIVTMDSYRGETFNATITRINPIMNERTKTFTIEAEFVDPPKALYPNLTLEANIIIQVKEKALTIPRNFILGEQYVIREQGDTIKVVLGVKDYQKAEILEGITENDVLVKPEL
jgi:multidrug efflux pump subunit AcrA (membrane-fusion protein)